MLQIPAWLLVASLVGGSWGLWSPWWEGMLPGLGIFSLQTELWRLPSSPSFDRPEMGVHR